MADPELSVLKDAIARNAAAVLSLPSAGMIRHHRTRLLGEADGGLWIESAPTEAALIGALIAERTHVGVAFKAGQTSMTFTSPISRCDPAYRLNDAITIEALWLSFPESLNLRQRRHAYRVGVATAADEPSVRLWRIADHAVLRDRPLAAQEVPCRLSDLSVLARLSHFGGPKPLADPVMAFSAP